MDAKVEEVVVLEEVAMVEGGRRGYNGVEDEDVKGSRNGVWEEQWCMRGAEVFCGGQGVTEVSSEQNKVCRG